MEFTCSRSCSALAHPSRKLYCSSSLYPCHLDPNKTTKDPPSPSSSLWHPIRCSSWPQVSHSSAETSLLSGNGAEILRRPRRNFEPQLSQRSYCLGLYDGDSPLLLVSPIPGYFLHLCCIHRMDPNLLSPSLSYGCDRWSYSGIRNNEDLFTVFSAFSGLWKGQLMSPAFPYPLAQS